MEDNAALVSRDSR